MTENPKRLLKSMLYLSLNAPMQKLGTLVFDSILSTQPSDKNATYDTLFFHPLTVCGWEKIVKIFGLVFYCGTKSDINY